MQQGQTQTPGQVRWEAYDPAGYHCEMLGRGRGSEAAIALIRDRIGRMSMAELRRGGAGPRGLRFGFAARPPTATSST